MALVLLLYRGLLADLLVAATKTREELIHVSSLPDTRENDRVASEMLFEQRASELVLMAREHKDDLLKQMRSALRVENELEPRDFDDQDGVGAAAE